MDEILKLVRICNYGYGDERFENDLPLLKITKKLRKLLKSTSINDKHESNCICGCVTTSTFWDSLAYGSIRHDVLQWLINEKYIDIDDNFDSQTNMLFSFGKLLENSGGCNRPDMPDNIHRATLFCFDLLDKHPKLLDRARSYRTDDYGISLIHSAFYGFAESQVISDYVNKMIDLGFNFMLTNAYYEQDEIKDQVEHLGLKFVGQSANLSCNSTW